jgi:hypothetical protein
MSVVICTGIGLVILLVGLAALFGIAWCCEELCEWLGKHGISLSKIGRGILAALVISMLSIAALAASYDIGCKVFHVIWH